MPKSIKIIKHEVLELLGEHLGPWETEMWNTFRRDLGFGIHFGSHFGSSIMQHWYHFSTEMLIAFVDGVGSILDVLLDSLCYPNRDRHRKSEKVKSEK